jgi:hypothetical protein
MDSWRAFGMKIVFTSLSLLFSLSAFALTLPEPQLTPGRICNAQDPDFEKYDYEEGIARCKRNVSVGDKQRVATNYGGIPRKDWPNYEFDHLIPLCAGGTNNETNIWPQPIDEAKDKDLLENQVCLKMRNGELLQHEAIQQMKNWFEEFLRKRKTSLIYNAKMAKTPR